VGVVRDDARLRAGEADRGHAARVQRHSQERHRDALARGEQHVELAPRRTIGDATREGQQLVGGVAHRRDHHDHVQPAGPRRGDAIRHLLDPGHVGHRRSAVLLDDDAHCGPSAKSQCRTPWLALAAQQ
jgi:hypothetical protein